MTSDITWGPEIRVDGVRPEWLGIGLCKAFVDDDNIFAGWTEDYEDRLETDPAGWKWVKEDGSPRITIIRLPADHPHYATLSHPTAPSGVEVGPEVVAKVREAIRQALQCTPTINPYRGVIEYDCGDPWAILRETLALLPEPVDPDAEVAVKILADKGLAESDPAYDAAYDAVLDALSCGRALAAGDRS